MNYYKELLKLKDIHGQEVYLYSTIDINHNDIFGLANVVDEFKSSLSDYQKWALHFNKEDAKAMAEALLDRIKELEKTEKTQTLTSDEIIDDLEKKYNELSIRVSRSFDIIVSLEKRIESLELALRSLSSHNNKKIMTEKEIGIIPLFLRLCVRRINMSSRHLSNKDIEKMKALAKGYEDMFDRHIHRRDEWLSKWVELIDIIIDILKKRQSDVKSKENQKS